ncbi:MAG TPA: hypothetical protein VHV27_11570 [Phenylobacterium sp.]|nr:hypothetical protein [Phenylobacterium sp.]
MNTTRLAAWLGIALGVVGAGLKVVRVLRQAEWWPFFLYDYFAAALLIIGGIAVLRRTGGVRVLAAGWGFGVAMCYGSFFGHLEKWTQGTGSDLAFEKTMSISVGVLLAINLVGLALTLWRGDQAQGLASRADAVAA